MTSVERKITRSSLYFNKPRPHTLIYKRAHFVLSSSNQICFLLSLSCTRYSFVRPFLMKEQSHTDCFIIEARLNDNRLKLYEKSVIKIRQLRSSDAILKILFFRFGYNSPTFSREFWWLQESVLDFHVYIFYITFFKRTLLKLNKFSD